MSPARVEIDYESIAARPGSHITDKQAVAIAPRFLALEQRDGTVTPEAVLDDARDPASPLHTFFEWDDTKAADLHRLATARTLVRSVVYRVKVLEGDAATFQPMLVRLRPEPAAKPAYVSFPRIAASPDLREQMLENARRDLVGWVRRYRTLEALAEAMPLAEQLLQRLQADTARHVDAGIG